MFAPKQRVVPVSLIPAGSDHLLVRPLISVSLTVSLNTPLIPAGLPIPCTTPWIPAGLIQSMFAWFPGILKENKQLAVLF